MGTQQPPAARNLLRTGLPAVLGAALVVALILGVYMVVPVPKEEDRPWRVVVIIVGIAVVYVFAAFWSVVRIGKTNHPLRVGTLALALMLTSVVVIFALTYLVIGATDPSSFNVQLDKVSALYFTMTILSTTGFGDITAVSHTAMIAVMLQMVVGLTLITAVARVIVEAVKRAAKRKQAEAG
ncbi:MAG: potassium channel family protein [Candidatus Nanopelagicales bacterium]